MHLTGQRFDQAFAKNEITAERQTIAVFKREAAHGKDAEVKAYATKMIPVLEKHVQLAEACAEQSVVNRGRLSDDAPVTGLYRDDFRGRVSDWSLALQQAVFLIRR